MPAALLLPLLLSWTSGGAAAPRNAEQLEVLRAGIDELRRQIDRKQGRRSALRKQLDTIERDIGQVANTLRDSHNTLSDQTEAQRFLTNQITRLERRVAEQRNQMLEIMRQLHLIGPGGQLRVLLSAESPNRFVRLHYYHHHLGQLRQQRIERFRTSIEQLGTAEHDSQQLARNMRERRATLRAQRKDLERHMAKHRSTLATLDTDLRRRNARLDRLVREQRQLQQLLEGVQRQLPTRKTDIKSQRHKLPRPVAGRIVNRFGTPRASGVVRWRGIRISAQDGTAVRAVHSGRVVFAHPFGDAGLLVILDHGGDYLSVYGNNQSLITAVGDEVGTGDVIATVGRSGGQTESGLYFELRHRGEPLDPLPWFKPD